jgi:RNA polymerase sigma factor (sigma-70 family)
MTDYTKCTGEELLVGFYRDIDASKEDRIFEEFVLRYSEKVRNHIRRKFPAIDQLCEDVLQQTFLRVVATKGNPGAEWREGHGGNVGRWLVTIASHEAVNYIQKENKERKKIQNLFETLRGRLAASGPAEEVASREQRKRREDFCRSLPPRERRVIELLLLDLCPTDEEVARLLEVSKDELSRAEERIRALVPGDQPPPKNLLEELNGIDKDVYMRFFIPRQLQKQEVAKMLGIHSSAVSRILKNFDERAPW